MERAALFVLAGHKGNGVAVAALAHAVQQGFVQPPANPLAHTVVGAVNGQLHIPRISCAAVPGVGAGKAAQLARCIDGNQERCALLHIGDIFALEFLGTQVILESGRGVGDIPVVQLRHGGGVLRRGIPQGDGVFSGPLGGKGFLFGFWQLFQGGFPLQGGTFIGAALGISQLNGTFGVGILGTGLAALVGAQAAGKVIGPAGIQTTIAQRTM